MGNLIKPPVRAPVGIRTSNLLIRSQMLYPVELRAPESHLICGGRAGRQISEQANEREKSQGRLRDEKRIGSRAMELRSRAASILESTDRSGAFLTRVTNQNLTSVDSRNSVNRRIK